MFKYTTTRAGDAVKLTFALPADQVVLPVSVLGDFNGWDPFAHPLKKRSNGTVSATVEVSPGQAIRFKYLASDGQWFCDPEAQTVVNDGSHTVDSLVVV